MIISRARWAPLFLMLLGLCMIVYPSISNLYYQNLTQDSLKQSTQFIEELSKETNSTELTLCDMYNSRLLQTKAIMTDPFDKNAKEIINGEYEHRLDLVGNGLMAKISIPSIGVSLPLYHGTEEDTLEHGLGHVETSSLPSGGNGTHCVVAGHTGLANMTIFDNLRNVEEGDLIYVDVANETHTYKVSAIETVLPEETKSLVIVPGKDLLTLVTCVPYGINSHRLLVHAERCEVPNETSELQYFVSQAPFSKDIIVISTCAITASLVSCLYIFLVHKINHK